MHKVLVVNHELCTGCRICEIVCSLVHEGECDPARARIRVLKVEPEGIDLPGVCQQCADAPCVEVCPIDALVRSERTGAVQVRTDLCIGCRACVLVCPYGAITVNGDRGVARKCDLCDGDPKCVQYCLTRAITYERPEVATGLRSAVCLGKFVEPVVRARRAAHEGEKGRSR